MKQNKKLTKKLNKIRGSIVDEIDFAMFHYHPKILFANNLNQLYLYSHNKKNKICLGFTSITHAQNFSNKVKSFFMLIASQNNQQLRLSRPDYEIEGLVIFRTIEPRFIKMSDDDVVSLYEQWSSEFCASWLAVTNKGAESFCKWAFTTPADSINN